MVAGSWSNGPLIKSLSGWIVVLCKETLRGFEPFSGLVSCNRSHVHLMRTSGTDQIKSVPHPQREARMNATHLIAQPINACT